MAPRPFTPDHIILGGIYHIRDESEYEADGHTTDMCIPARHHNVLVIGAVAGKPGHWRIMTVRPQFRQEIQTHVHSS
jgi:hypothetical protein